jgi:signal transduction histidine kinase
MKRRLLVIDDNKPFREQVCEFLTCCDYEVIAASDGTEGLELARTAAPDLVICDVMMPGMDGFTLLEHLRASSLTAALPLIFVTARAQRSDTRLGMGLGADDYLTKPFTMDELLRSIETRLTRKKQEDTSARRLAGKHLRMAARLNHELRTPLSGLVGVSDLLRLAGPVEGADPQFCAKWREILDGSIDRLRHTIEMLLLYAEIESGTWLPDKESGVVALDIIASEEAMDLSRQSGREADLEVSVRNGCSVAVPEAHAKLIVRELVGNAIKFSRPGARISVRLAPGESELEIALEVLDSGVGMKPEEIERVGPFQQFREAEWAQQGLGLGLYLSRLLAEAYSARVSLTPLEPKGTGVRVVWQATK